jgi:hypothetical protein
MKEILIIIYTDYGSDEFFGGNINKIVFWLLEMPVYQAFPQTLKNLSHKSVIKNREDGAMANFFRELASCEKIVLMEGHRDMSDGTIVYDNNTKRLLLHLIRFVESGELAGSSKAFLFICQNFRLDSVEMTKAWNSDDTVKKSANTFRSQISTLSRKYYQLFGKDFYSSFVIQDKDKLALININLTAWESQSVSFGDLFFSGTEDACTGDGKFLSYNFKTQDCMDELKVMRKILKKNVISALAHYDINKLEYIRYVLDSPLMDKKMLKINEEKVKMLKALGVLFSADGNAGGASGVRK